MGLWTIILTPILMSLFFNNQGLEKNQLLRKQVKKGVDHMKSYNKLIICKIMSHSLAQMLPMVFD